MANNEMMEAFVGKELTRFNPRKTKVKLAKLDGVAEYAKKMQDWPLLEKAIDAKIQEQIDFCQWWAKKVTPRESNPKAVTGLLPLSRSDVNEWKMRVSRWTGYLKTIQPYRDRLLGAEYKAALLQPLDNYLAGTGENEWCTPAEYIEAARKVLGEIDLDPASSDLGQETVKAKAYFTKQTNGLDKEWRGKIWLNPPYASPLIWQFIEKLTGALKTGHVSEAILLTHNATDTAWFHLAEEIARRICWTRGRIKFIKNAVEEASPTQGQAFFYYG